LADEISGEAQFAELGGYRAVYDIPKHETKIWIGETDDL